MKRVRQIYNAFMRAVKEGSVPFGYYGPETCRWATLDEMRRFGLEDCPMVHLDKSGKIDCYFTETGATVVPGASHHQENVACIGRKQRSVDCVEKPSQNSASDDQ
jgi:hypothetical protein